MDHQAGGTHDTVYKQGYRRILDPVVGMNGRWIRLHKDIVMTAYQPQHFYYHFQDITALLEHILNADVERVLSASIWIWTPGRTGLPGLPAPL